MSLVGQTDAEVEEVDFKCIPFHSELHAGVARVEEQYEVVQSDLWAISLAQNIIDVPVLVNGMLGKRPETLDDNSMCWVGCGFSSVSFPTRSDIGLSD